MVIGAGPTLLGRVRECTVLDALVADVRAGRGTALVIRGEAGVGKTALLDHLMRTADDCQVVRVTGVETEMELVYAGLNQICAPFLARLDRLPAPQARALQVALGLERGGAPDRFLVGLATLSLLSDAADDRPIICVIDDAQWLDRASNQTFGFVGRRLLADRVALVFAVREPSLNTELDGLTPMVVRGLDDLSARTLLISTVAGLIDEQVRARVVADTRGNPLALLELTRGMTAADLAAGVGPTRGVALPSRVEERFLHRIGELDPAVQRLLLVAAAEPTGDPVLLWGAAGRLGIPPAAVDAISTSGLVEINGRVVFRHPLARSAAYRAGSADEIRAAHLALAEVTDPLADSDRQVWHLAAATAGPDDELAVKLEGRAGQALARGGLSAAAAFLRRGVTLTGDPSQRAIRALRAAEVSLLAGAFNATDDMLAIAAAGQLDALPRVRLELVRADAAYSRSRGADGPALLLAAASSFEPLDAELARKTYLDAWSAALFAGPLAASGAGLVEVSRRALSAPPLPAPPQAFDQLLVGFSLAMTSGRAAAAPDLRRGASAFATDRVRDDDAMRWGWLASAAAVMVWDYDIALAVATRGVAVARKAGALTVLAVGDNVLAQLTCISGNLEAAAALVDEATTVTEATGDKVAPFGELLLIGMHGREDALAVIDTTVAQVAGLGQGVTLQHAQWSRAILYNGLGRFREAYDAARVACADTPELFISSWATSELIESAVEIGELRHARNALAGLAAAAEAAGTDLAIGVLARCRALLADGDTAEPMFVVAIERLGRTRVRPELARAQLLYGQWLRAHHRVDDARIHLRVAHDAFVECHMEAFEDRARRELAETGVRLRVTRAAQAAVELTPREGEIARLAAAGLGNPEIGAKLFVSHRTVEWHLRKVFMKLGIASRADLPGAIAGATRRTEH